MYGFGMGLAWLIPLLLIIVLVYYMNRNTKESLSAKEILERRYALGEIDEQEYRQMRDELDKE